jgi:D-ribose pyranase
MKHNGLLNPALSALVARAGHTQMIVIADAGLPIPDGVPRIDLSITAGLPELLAVLRAILGELVIENATVASETRVQSAAWYASLCQDLPRTPLEISHEEIKALLPHVLAVVRTGETTPYANVVLHCGVNF